MTKKREAAEQEAVLAERSLRHSPGWLTVLSAGVLAFVAAAACTYALARQPAPLGTPVPNPPLPMFHLTSGATDDSSFIKRDLPPGWLSRLAPQPDGTPYMYNVYTSDKLGFTIRYPYGAENIQFGGEAFAVDGVESQAKVRIDQPLAAVKVSVPANQGKMQLEFAQQLFADAVKTGAKPVEEPRTVQFSGGGFVTLAYRRDEPEANYVHRIYCAVISKRALVFDFMLRPEAAADGEKYAEKIMRSFECGSMLKPLMERPPVKAEEKKDAPATPKSQSSKP